MRLVFLALTFGLAPGLAAANCGTAELRVCVFQPPVSVEVLVVPCAVTQCSTADAVFDYLAFDGPAYARIDVTGESEGMMNADFAGLGPEEDLKVEALPVQITGDFAYANGNQPILSTRPCDALCADVDVEELME